MHSVEYASKYTECNGRECFYFVSQIISLDKSKNSFFVQFCCFICYDSWWISISLSQNTMKALPLFSNIGDGVSEKLPSVIFPPLV